MDSLFIIEVLLLRPFGLQLVVLRINYQQILIQIADRLELCYEVKKVMDSRWDEDLDKVLYIVQKKEYEK
jgi:hypothetical protein